MHHTLIDDGEAEPVTVRGSAIACQTDNACKRARFCAHVTKRKNILHHKL